MCANSHVTVVSTLESLEGLCSVVDTTNVGVWMDNISGPAISKMRRRLTLLESMHHEWIEDLVATLKTIPSYENAIISSPDGPFTVAELVDDIQKLRPRGVEYIRLWRRTLVTLSKGRK